MRRAARVAGGAPVGAVACGAVASGATVLADGRSHGAAALTAAVTLVVFLAVVRRFRFVRPSARAQRVSPWMAAAPALIDVELALALTAGAGAAIAATG